MFRFFRLPLQRWTRPAAVLLSHHWWSAAATYSAGHQTPSPSSSVSSATLSTSPAGSTTSFQILSRNFLTLISLILLTYSTAIFYSDTSCLWYYSATQCPTDPHVESLVLLVLPLHRGPGVHQQLYQSVHLRRQVPWVQARRQTSHDKNVSPAVTASGRRRLKRHSSLMSRDVTHCSR